MRFYVSIILFYLCTAVYAININVTKSHPRILLERGEEKSIRKLIDRDTCMMSVHNYIIESSDKYLSLKPSERIKTGKRLLAVSRVALQRIYYLSYAYRMTGDKKYADRAKNEMLAVCDFTDWNPSHYLDVGEMTMAVAIGYDWLYDYLSDSERKKIRTAIVEKAFNTAEIGGFYNRTNNWNQVCNAGLVYGALAIFEDERELSSKIIEKAVKTVPLSMDSYLPDGAYPEGYSYWGYGTGFQVAMIAAMESALETDFELSEHKGFKHSPYFMLYTTTPSGMCYNYCDSGKKNALNQAMFWFASKSKDLSLLWYEYSYLRNLSKYTGSDTDRLLPNILIFSKDIDLKRITEPKGNFWVSAGLKPLYVYKSGWNKKDDTYLGIVGGAASIPHGHMDVGSYIYEKDGIRWAIDLGLQSYYSLEKEGVDLWNNTQNGQRWNVFRLGNTAHSTITINNEKHIVDGKVIFNEIYKSNDKKGVLMDMTPLYGKNIKNVTRELYLDENDNLCISDEITTGQNPADIMWVMVTSAKAKIINGNEIELTKDGKRKTLAVNSNGSFKLKIWDNKPVHNYDQPNPGTLRIGFESTISGNSKVEFNISLK